MACSLNVPQVKFAVLRAIRKNTGKPVTSATSLWFDLNLGIVARQYIFFWVRAEIRDMSPGCLLPWFDVGSLQTVGQVQNEATKALGLP